MAKEVIFSPSSNDVDDLYAPVDPPGSALCVIFATLLYSTQREQHYLLRVRLVCPSTSPWKRLWCHEDGKSRGWGVYAAVDYPRSWHVSLVSARLVSKAISSLGDYKILWRSSWKIRWANFNINEEIFTPLKRDCITMRYSFCRVKRQSGACEPFEADSA